MHEKTPGNEALYHDRRRRHDRRAPQRILIDRFVDSLAVEQARLEGMGVPFIRKQGVEPWGGVTSTFVDPDGNYVQLIEYKPVA